MMDWMICNTCIYRDVDPMIFPCCDCKDDGPEYYYPREVGGEQPEPSVIFSETKVMEIATEIMRVANQLLASLPQDDDEDEEELEPGSATNVSTCEVDINCPIDCDRCDYARTCETYNLLDQPDDEEEEDDPRNIFTALGMEIGDLVNKKNIAYGDSFAKCGEFLKLLYPNGIAPGQYADMLGIVRIFDKQMRIATDPIAFNEEPWKDIAGYGLLGLKQNMKRGG